jgi:hypothetical protein
LQTAKIEIIYEKEEIKNGFVSVAHLLNLILSKSNYKFYFAK